MSQGHCQREKKGRESTSPETPAIPSPLPPPRCRRPAVRDRRHNHQDRPLRFRDRPEGKLSLRFRVLRTLTGTRPTLCQVNE